MLRKQFYFLSHLFQVRFFMFLALGVQEGLGLTCLAPSAIVIKSANVSHIKTFSSKIFKQKGRKSNHLTWQITF